MGVSFHEVDAQEAHQDRVIDLAIQARLTGQSFDPSHDCSVVIFDALWKKAKELGATYVATGHYASIGQDAQGHCHLMSTKDEESDQTYELCLLGQKHLEKTLFPLSHVPPCGSSKGGPIFGDSIYREDRKKTAVSLLKPPSLSQFIEEQVPRALFKEGLDP